MKTKSRILEVSRCLFNQHGVEPISSLQIATELGISPGNLYYHFRGKDEILAVLVSECDQLFADDSQAFLREVESLEHYWAFLHRLMEHFLRYQFIFRSLDHLHCDSPALGRRIRALVRRLKGLIMTMLERLASLGVLHVDQAEQAILADNLLLVGLHWAHYQILQDPGLNESALLRKGVIRMLTLVSPYIAPEHGAALVQHQRWAEQLMG
ncbi:MULTISPECIES: TetR/AcrR family transcriptional regulator [Vibrio]|uniref:TetR/AcrR family transcriptional regulator n=1 Tax=Vibrio TaxID=662 RepID=UPI00155338BF|nr:MULTISPECIES: TetR/AcrR family transcriptional regulator [unclassified Vibrio]